MKKDERIIQSEKAIIEAGITALLANPNAGMSEIAAAAGVGRATLYRHFETREALIQALAIECFKEIDEATNSLRNLTAQAAIEAAFDVLMPLVDRYRFLANLWSIALDSKEVRRIEKRQQKEMHALIEQAKKEGAIDKKLPTVWVSTFFDNTLTTAWMLVESGDIKIKEASKYCKRSFFNGCGINRY